MDDVRESDEARCAFVCATPYQLYGVMAIMLSDPQEVARIDALSDGISALYGDGDDRICVASSEDEARAFLLP